MCEDSLRPICAICFIIKDAAVCNLLHTDLVYPMLFPFCFPFPCWRTSSLSQQNSRSFLSLVFIEIWNISFDVWMCQQNLLVLYAKFCSLTCISLTNLPLTSQLQFPHDLVCLFRKLCLHFSCNNDNCFAFENYVYAIFLMMWVV